jgi:hypothetical protein
VFLFPDDDKELNFLDALEQSLRKNEYQEGNCRECGKELMPESDAYWGREPGACFLCYDCRKQRGVEG